MHQPGDEQELLRFLLYLGSGLTALCGHLLYRSVARTLGWVLTDPDAPHPARR